MGVAYLDSEILQDKFFLNSDSVAKSFSTRCNRSESVTGVEMPPTSFDEDLAREFTADAGEPFADPEGALLPPVLHEAAASWERPAGLLTETLAAGAELCVVHLAGAPRVASCDIVCEAADAAAKAAATALASAMHLIADHAEKFDDGAFLWELIWPRSEEGQPVVSPTGRYGVKLWEHGAWRLVTIDDRVPLDRDGKCLLPLSGNRLELWPLLLSKALLKLSSGGQGGRGEHELALHRLTGWMPAVAPVLPTVPAATTWSLVASMLARADTIVGLTLPPSGSEDSDALLEEKGLIRPAMLTVCDAREVEGRRYMRLRSRYASWRGPFCDVDESSWTPALASSLGWSRMQRLRMRAAGQTLLDFWVDEASLLSLFGAVHMLHRPAASTATSVTELDRQKGAEQARLLVLPASDEAGGSSTRVQMCVQAPGAQEVGFSLSRFEWSSCTAPAPLLSLVVRDVWTAELDLREGIYHVEFFLPAEASKGPLLNNETTSEASVGASNGMRGGSIAAAGDGEAELNSAEAESVANGSAEATEATVEAEEADAPPLSCSLFVSHAQPVQLGEVRDVLRDALSVHSQTVSGTTKEVPPLSWAVALAVTLKPKASGTMCVTIRPPGSLPASCCRLHAVDDATGESTRVVGFCTGPVACSDASGVTLLLDVKAPAGKTPLSAGEWHADIVSDVEVEISAAELGEATLPLEQYSPNTDYRLFRSTLSSSASCSAVVHVACEGFPSAKLTLRQLRVDAEPAEAGLDRATSVIRAVTGVGCVTMHGLLPDGAPGGALLECVVDRHCAALLELPNRPVQGLVDAPPTAADEEAGEPGEDEEAGEPGEDRAETKPARGTTDLSWRLLAVAPGDVTVEKDAAFYQSLDALKSTWEAAEAGRASRAKSMREAFLAHSRDDAQPASSAAAPVRRRPLSESQSARVLSAEDWEAAAAGTSEERVEAHKKVCEAAAALRAQLLERSSAASLAELAAAKEGEVRLREASARSSSHCDGLVASLLPAACTAQEA